MENSGCFLPWVLPRELVLRFHFGKQGEGFEASGVERGISEASLNLRVERLIGRAGFRGLDQGEVGMPLYTRISDPSKPGCHLLVLLPGTWGAPA